MTSKLIATFGALGVAAGAILTTAAPALAASSGYSNQAAMNLSITGAKFTMRKVNSEACRWTVSSNVTVINLTSQAEQATGVSATVAYQGPGSNGGSVPATIFNPGTPSLTTGQTFAPYPAKEVFNAVQVSFTIPCKAVNGTLSLDVADQYGTGSADVPFLVNGTPLPLGVVGGSVGALAVGGLFAGTQLRRRRKAGATA